MIVYLGADHRGFELKEKVFQWLVDKEYKVEDFGAYEYVNGDDYTKYAEKVASVVGESEDSRGVLFCGSGVGVDVTANKFDGVRASIGKNNDQVKAGRNDDDLNVLVIASDYTTEEEAKAMIDTFLKTAFSGKERYRHRLEEIRKIEANN
jgi:ribose 5-phosphate isomerase B